MTRVPFFMPIAFAAPGRPCMAPLIEACDNLFYFGGGWVNVSINDKALWICQGEKTQRQPLWKTALKVLGIATLILPLLALLVKAAVRTARSLVINSSLLGDRFPEAWKAQIEKTEGLARPPLTKKVLGELECALPEEIRKPEAADVPEDLQRAVHSDGGQSIQLTLDVEALPQGEGLPPNLEKLSPLTDGVLKCYTRILLTQAKQLHAIGDLATRVEIDGTRWQRNRDDPSTASLTIKCPNDRCLVFRYQCTTHYTSNNEPIGQAEATWEIHLWKSEGHWFIDVQLPQAQFLPDPTAHIWETEHLIRWCCPSPSLLR